MIPVRWRQAARSGRVCETRLSSTIISISYHILIWVVGCGGGSSGGGGMFTVQWNPDYCRENASVSGGDIWLFRCCKRELVVEQTVGFPGRPLPVVHNKTVTLWWNTVLIPKYRPFLCWQMLLHRNEIGPHSWKEEERGSLANMGLDIIMADKFANVVFKYIWINCILIPVAPFTNLV